MPVTAHDIYRLLGRLEENHRAATAMLTELRAQLATIKLPDPSDLKCPDCGITMPGPRKLAEHRYISHAGSEPEHWLEAERKADW